MTAPDAASPLHPVAASADLLARHVVRSRLFGRGLAIWRADDGFINIWEDHCIHRGMRLSAGVNDGAELARITRQHGPMQHAYLCGPGPMIDATRAIAGEAGWPSEAVHFEYFKNESAGDDGSAFDVTLARRGQTLRIGTGVSLLDGLRRAGIDLPSSCEQGACGTCVATVLDGEPDHQDVYFKAAERAAGDRLLTCVSRAKGGRLVLDL